jgi:DNA ligase 4
VAVDLHNPEVRMKRQNAIELMQMFKPMLGQRETSLNAIFNSFKKGDFYIETKYDGDRVMMHKQGGEYLLHSRKPKDWSAQCVITSCRLDL